MILVTGGAGYIGSHCVMALVKKGYEVCVFDNLSTGHSETVETLQKLGTVDFTKGDLLKPDEINSVFETKNIDAVMHFAAFSQVGESVKNPQKYYINNLVGTLNLLQAMIAHKVNLIIFSSTAAVYGEPDYLPIDENHPARPINPYGKTKLMIENILDDYDVAYGLKSVRLRYFNASGADTDSLIGEWHTPETHLIPNILKSTFEGGKTFELYGTDYDTKDGTCVRDYINVEDLAKAHISALEYLKIGGKTDFFNLGTQKGITVKEIFSTCEEVTGRKIPVIEKPRREGDPAGLIADNKKAQEILNWEPLNDIVVSVKTAYNWEKVLRRNFLNE